MSTLNGKVRLGRQGELVLVRIEQEGNTLRMLQFSKPDAMHLAGKIDELVAIAATKREPSIYIQWGESGVTSAFPLTEGAELARNMKRVANGEDIGLKLPMEPLPDNAVIEEHAKMITQFCDPYYTRGLDVVHALRDLLLERAAQPTLLRILADEAFRNGVAVKAGREMCGEYKASGDVEVLVARAKAQVKP